MNNVSGCEQNVLTLIDRQKAETERLQSMNQAKLDTIHDLYAENKRLEKEVNLVSIQFQDLQERYEEAQAEIERLEKETEDKERAYNDEFCLEKNGKLNVKNYLKKNKPPKPKQ